MNVDSQLAADIAAFEASPKYSVLFASGDAVVVHGFSKKFAKEIARDIWSDWYGKVVSATRLAA